MTPSFRYPIRREVIRVEGLEALSPRESGAINGYPLIFNVLDAASCVTMDGRQIQFRLMISSKALTVETDALNPFGRFDPSSHSRTAVRIAD